MPAHARPEQAAFRVVATEFRAFEADALGPLRHAVGGRQARAGFWWSSEARVFAASAGVGSGQPSHEYRRVIRDPEHELEFHSGHMSSGGTRALQTLMKRCDLVVIVTDVNSHAAVSKARQLARAAGRSPNAHTATGEV